MVGSRLISILPFAVELLEPTLSVPRNCILFIWLGSFSLAYDAYMEIPNRSRIYLSRVRRLEFSALLVSKMHSDHL